MVDTVFYNNMAQVTFDQFAAKGRQGLVLRRQTAGTYDPREDQEVPGAHMEQPLTCIILPVSQGVVEAFDNRVEGGTLIEANMRLLKIAALGLLFEPKAGDIVPDLEGSHWTALGSTPINPAGIPIMYNVTVRRG